MGRQILAFVTLCSLVFFLCAYGGTVLGDVPADKSDDTKSLSRAKSPRHLTDRLDRVFSAVSARDLDRLALEPDFTCALSAGWQRVRRTMPEAMPNHDVSPDGEAIARFLGLIEGRLQVAVPDAWEATVKSAKSHDCKNTWFSCPKKLKQLTGADGRIRRVDDEWLLDRDGLSIRIPAGCDIRENSNIAVQIDGDNLYLALYDCPPTPYRLVAIDRASNKINWSSEVWAAGGVVSYTGKGWHFAEIRLERGLLFVFGLSGDSAYVEIFDKSTGENSCRFSTAYLDAISRK